MTDLSTLVVLCSVGTIGVIQWTKELVQSVSTKNFDHLYQVLLSLFLSIVSGLVIWKIKYSTETYYMVFPLTLGVLSVVQLGYDNIIKYLQQAIEGIMKKFISNEQDK